MRRIFVAPSILTADFSYLKTALSDIENSGADWIHLDVMDGAFVPPITFGAKLVADLHKRTRKPLDVHLMVEHPEKYIEPFKDAGADYLTFHAEAAVHSYLILQRIRQAGMKAGISIVPGTPVSALDQLLPLADLVLVMTVNPGAGGQTLLPDCLEKVTELRALREGKALDFLISVDGGINRVTAPQAIGAGIDAMVVGSAFFDAEDKKFFVGSLRNAFTGTVA